MQQTEQQRCGSGRVFWITGLSGSGKTTVGRLLYARLKAVKSNVVFLDGDMLREVFGHDLGYTYEDRYKSAMRNARLCQMLSSQGMDVVCATISMFHACRNWNRTHIPNYVEIYLRVSMDTLMRRNQKGLYAGAASGSVRNVVGMDTDCEEPDCSDLVIDNEGDRTPEHIVSQILEEV